MVIAALGPYGTFSHELVVRLYREEPLLLPTIAQVFAHVERGAAIGIVPIENSEAGGVGPTQDCLCRYSVWITGEYYLPIHHHLASFSDRAHIELIYAHPQTHEQCSEVFEQLDLPVVHTSSNAASACVHRRRRPLQLPSRISQLSTMQSRSSAGTSRIQAAISPGSSGSKIAPIPAAIAINAVSSSIPRRTSRVCCIRCSRRLQRGILTFPGSSQGLQEEGSGATGSSWMLRQCPPSSRRSAS